MQGLSLGKGGMHPLLHRKDIEVPNMPAEMSREEFLLWRDKVVDFLEASGSEGISPLLEELHTRMNPCSVNDCQGIANEKGIGNGRTSQEEMASAAMAVYSLLKSKFNPTARSLCLDVKDRNGLEVYRRLSLKYAPSTGQPYLVLFDQIQDYRMVQCKKFEDTYDTVKRLERLIKEHDRVVMGQGDGPIGEQNKVSIMWRLIDEKTKDKATQRADLRRENRSSEAILTFLEELYVDEPIEKSHRKRTVPMEVSALNQALAGNGEPTGDGEEEKYTGAEWAQYMGMAAVDPGASEHNALDAMGKGGNSGGKGGKYGGKAGLNLSGAYRPAIVCRRCGGAGHPERVCGTPEGSTSTTACAVCKGKGHWVKDCTRYGGGKYLSPAQRKGGGKGGRGVTSLEDAMSQEHQAVQQTSHPPAGTTMFAQWSANAMQGPWMQPASAQAGGAFKAFNKHGR